MKATIYDVAKEANVSIATVSNVINNKEHVSEKTKQTVMNAMSKLKYTPNIFASGLMGKSTNTLGLLIPDLANSFFAELARNIEDRGEELGYNLVICNTDYEVSKEKKYLALLKQKKVDGFILASGFEDFSTVEALMKENIPVVIVARDFPMFSVNAVALDDFMGGYLAAKHFIELGHQNIGIIARDSWSNRERIRGFEYALKENNLCLNNFFKFVDEIDLIKAGRDTIEAYINSEETPTALFACNDLLAAGAIQRAKELKLKIPEDISIIGFDNTSISTIIEPPLTTIAQPIKKMGHEVVDLMISVINGESKENSRITLLPNLIVRKSTARNHNNT